jgi:hypothetical protein
MTKFSNLTTKELISLHRYDIQGDDLVDELWHRLEMYVERDKDARVATKYVEENAK